ncbi:Oidioi.mRNA.OKI2018_I69.chr2.g4808.t1.cds [Oikopleura dioica]|uniref:Oidioi.mRNA.OKI2018_I69.chr2.g4808.t1.cds n=1 Tax=Oikopleura dioica TaxID=34765 RepID=A0ABN7T2S4_OIKDI|nr:Oidioi.mRNA.OKI2018_I69.chr2.g4808.t1.cds [Oikopleura dioica]
MKIFYLFLHETILACSQCSGEADGCSAMQPDDFEPQVQIAFNDETGEMMTVTEPPSEEKLREGKDGNLGFGMQFWDERVVKYINIKLLHDSQKHVIKSREVERSELPSNSNWALGVFNNNNKRLKSITKIQPGEMTNYAGYSKDSIQLFDLSKIKSFETDNCWAEMVKINGEYHGFDKCESKPENFNLTPKEENCTLLTLDCELKETIQDGKVQKDLECDLFWKCGVEKVEKWYQLAETTPVKTADVEDYVEKEITNIRSLLN